MRGRSTLAAAALAFAMGCAKAPPVPEVPIWYEGSEGLRVEDRERALWEEAAGRIAELETEGVFVSHPPLDALIDEVLDTIAPPFDSRGPRLRVFVVRSAERNAGALADGTIMLSLGLLAALGNEAQLAGLLAHELSHVMFRHQLVMKQYEMLTPSTVHRMELSRAQEWEADRYAFVLIKHAGYDAAQLRRMLDLLDPVAPSGGVRVVAWESHPDLAARKLGLAKLASRDVPERRLGTSRYEQAITGILLLAAELELEAGQLERAEAAVDRYLRLVPDSGRGYYWKAEIARRTQPGGRRSRVVRSAYERAVELAPEDPDALRALGLLLRETGETRRARELLGRYLVVAPDAVDQRLIERYLVE